MKALQPRIRSFAPGYLSFFIVSDHFDFCPKFLSKQAVEFSVAIWPAQEPSSTDNWLRHIIDGPTAMRAGGFSGVHFVLAVEAYSRSYTKRKRSHRHQPFTQTIGTRRATRRASFARSAASATALTSL